VPVADQRQAAAGVAQANGSHVIDVGSATATTPG
jgi:hypothetical protein